MLVFAHLAASFRLASDALLALMLLADVGEQLEVLLGNGSRHCIMAQPFYETLNYQTDLQLPVPSTHHHYCQYSHELSLSVWCSNVFLTIAYLLVLKWW